MKIQTFEFGGETLQLQLAASTFEPNLTTRLLAEIVPISPGARVLDLGCGVGPIAIVAARKGAGEVIGVDIMPEACETARRNAALNGVDHRIRFLESNLFEQLEHERFDIIIDDVSGMADGVSRISPWYPASIPTGGPDGTGPTIRMLEQAPDHLRPGGRLFFPVLSLANRAKMLETARAVFKEAVECVAQKWIPFCDEFKDHLPALEAMRAEGIVDFTSKRSRHLWQLEIYRATV
jgi:SAM-dependent methyltransferase